MTVLLLSLVFIALFGWVFYDFRRERARRNSLRQRSDGIWVWIDYDGTPRTSERDPRAPGGVWFVQGGTGGYGGGACGGGGGDGGGGGGCG